MVGVEAGIKKIPYRLNGDYFLEAKQVNNRQLKQAGNLMSNDHHAFNLALAERLKGFAGEMGGEYAERAIEVIDKLAELDKVYASKQREKEMVKLKNAATNAYSRLKAFKLF